MLRLRLDPAAGQSLLAFGPRHGFECGATAARGVRQAEHEIVHRREVQGVVRLRQLDPPRRDGTRTFERQIPFIVESQMEEAWVVLGLARSHRLHRHRVDDEP